MHSTYRDPHYRQRITASSRPMRFREWLLRPIINKLETSMSDLTDALAAKLADLNTSVAANTSATSSVVALVDGYKTQIADLQTQLQNAHDNSDDEALQDAINGLGTLKDQIDADTAATNVMANTPAAPAPDQQV